LNSGWGGTPKYLTSHHPLTGESFSLGSSGGGGPKGNCKRIKERLVKKTKILIIDRWALKRIFQDFLEEIEK